MTISAFRYTTMTPAGYVLPDERLAVYRGKHFTIYLNEAGREAIVVRCIVTDSWHWRGDIDGMQWSEWMPREQAEAAAREWVGGGE